MDLSTEYMGLKLKNPIIVSSSKLTGDINNIKKCADVGAGAIILKSVFEEQLIADSNALMDQDIKYFWFPEAIEYINKHSKEYGLKQVLELIKKAKAYTDIPVLSSINCVTSQEWPKFAKQLEDAGADGIELNIAIFPFDKYMSCTDICDQYIDIVEKVKEYVSIPVSVKLGNYFTNLVQITHRIDEAGADGLVLFNRGIHDYSGVVKQLLAGASATQICSTLFNNGLSYIDTILFDLEKWMQKHKYKSITDFKGKVTNAEDSTQKFERMQYLKKEI
jgi:dihydroorotate dehydrogenase (fumarate)